MDQSCSESRRQVLGNDPGASEIVPITMSMIADIGSMCSKKSGKNRRDLKELAETIIEFIEAVHAVTNKVQDDPGLQSQQICADFTE